MAEVKTADAAEAVALCAAAGAAAPVDVAEELGADVDAPVADGELEPAAAVLTDPESPELE